MRKPYVFNNIICVKDFCDRCGKEVHDTIDYRNDVERTYYILRLTPSDITACNNEDRNFAPGIFSCILCPECALDAIKRAMEQ